MSASASKTAAICGERVRPDTSARPFTEIPSPDKSIFSIRNNEAAGFRPSISADASRQILSSDKSDPPALYFTFPHGTAALTSTEGIRPESRRYGSESRTIAYIRTAGSNALTLSGIMSAGNIPISRATSNSPMRSPHDFRSGVSPNDISAARFMGTFPATTRKFSAERANGTKPSATRPLIPNGKFAKITSMPDRNEARPFTSIEYWSVPLPRRASRSNDALKSSSRGTLWYAIRGFPRNTTLSTTMRGMFRFSEKVPIL